jgi:hypothetical protein
MEPDADAEAPYVSAGVADAVALAVVVADTVAVALDVVELDSLPVLVYELEGELLGDPVYVYVHWYCMCL